MEKAAFTAAFLFLCVGNQREKQFSRCKGISFFAQYKQMIFARLPNLSGQRVLRGKAQPDLADMGLRQTI